jgi:transcriptional regulator with XRE-family HTH domain
VIHESGPAGTAARDAFIRRCLALRTQAGLTLREACALSSSSISASSLSHIEQGRADPALSMAADIAAIYGMTLAEMLSQEEE